MMDDDKKQKVQVNDILTMSMQGDERCGFVGQALFQLSLSRSC